ncbi:MAG: hypothetical protein J5984_01205, partial [Clostridia bacterium]|nr:hypothetical protein [Clostridia bacterium]
MNKKILMLLVILTVSVGVIVGCSKVTKQENSETSVNILQSEVMEDEPIPSDSDKDVVDQDASKATRQEDSETSVSIIQSEVMEDEPIPSDSDKVVVDEDASEV